MFLGLVARQQTVGMPVRFRRAVIHTSRYDRPIAIAVYPVDQDFFPDSRDVYAAISTARIGHRDSHPAGCIRVAIVEPIPMKAHLDAIELVGIDLFVGRSNNDGRLLVHLRLVMLKWTAIRHDPALRFYFNEKETFTAGVWDLQ